MASPTDTHLAALRKKKAEYMREYGRRKGAKAVKGTSFICVGCSGTFPKLDVKQKRCSPCRDDYRREFGKNRRLRVGHVAIGSLLNCKQCGVQFAKRFKRHFYCAECTKLSETEALPHQIENRRARTAKNMRHRRRTIPRVAISTRMSAGIKNSLRDGKQGRSWESLVGYSVTDLMAHLERKFVDGMSWKNRGKWHIDHVRPLASFSFATPNDPDFKMAWALDNLQPLWAMDNIRKSARMDWSAAE